MESSQEEIQKSPTSEKSPTAISNTRILWCSIGLTILAGLMLPVQLGKKYKAEISITATGVKDENVKGVEVWVSESGGPGIVANANAADWERRDQVQVSYKLQPATLSWKGEIDSDYRLYFVRHPYSGRMILTINGQSKDYTLYTGSDQAPLVIQPYEYIANPQPVYGASFVKAVLSLIGLFALIHFTLLLLIRRSHNHTKTGRFTRRNLVLLALPSLFVYTVTLLAMWPAQMSPDSVSHWVESETGIFTDSHPALLTMALWVATRFWHSPTVIPFLQILALTGVTVLIISKFREFGLSSFICSIIAVSFPLFPANFLMVTTIWKDVPYSIALMFSFWLMLSLTQTKGGSASIGRWRFYFIGAMLLVMFTRHNGIVVALAFPLVCAIGYRRIAGRFFVGTTLGLFALFLVVKSVLFPALHIAPLQRFYLPANAIHVLGAHVKKGSHFTKEEESLLQSVYGLDRWKSLYTCQTLGYLIGGDSQGTPSYEALATHAHEFISLAMKKSWEHPGVYLHHQACVTSLLWRIIPFRGEGIYISPFGVTQVQLAKDFKLAADPKLPRIQILLHSLFNWTQNESRIWLYWRPGLWLLLSVIAGVGFALAARDARLLLLLAPSILNTLSLLPFITAPDYRYQWVVVAVGMFLVPLALFRRTLNVTTPSPADSRSIISTSLGVPRSTSPELNEDFTSLRLVPGSAPRIAVVLPCYRVREHILPLLSRIGPECSLIYCVDDKCPESSGSYILEHIKDPRVRVLFHDMNQGVGGAVMTGYRAAIQDGANVLVKIDGDGQMDPALLPAFVAPILEGSADYTKGNRFYHIEDVREMPAIRLVGNAVLSFLTKLSSGYWSTFDPTNGYTAIHSSVARLLPFAKIDRRYFFESDMLFRLNVLKCSRRGYTQWPPFISGEKSSLVISSIIGEFLWKHARNYS